MLKNIDNVQFRVVILDPYTNVKLDVIIGYSIMNLFIIHIYFTGIINKGPICPWLCNEGKGGHGHWPGSDKN